MTQCPIYISTLGLQTNNKVHIKPYNIQIPNTSNSRTLVYLSSVHKIYKHVREQIHNYVAQDSTRVVRK